MRFIFLGIFVFFFVAMPMYLLNTMVMPELKSMKGIYGNADMTASRVAGNRLDP